MRPINGIKIIIRNRKVEKYKIEATWLVKGYSTDCSPIHLSASKLATGIQIGIGSRDKMLWFIFDEWRVGMITNLRLKNTGACTPLSLLEVEHRIS